MRARTAVATFAAVAALLISVASPARAVFPGGNGHIAYRGSGGQCTSSTCIFLVSPVGGDDALLINRSSDHPHWNPAGTKLVFDGNGRRNSSDIFTAHVDGSHVRNLTSNGADDEDPAWSNNGRMIAFSSDRKNGVAHIFRMRSDGTRVKQLTFGSNEGSEPDWSVNGLIVFQDAGSIWVMNGNGSNLHTLNVCCGAPSWSPDGNKIVFGGAGGIWSMDANGTNQTQLTTGAFDDHPTYSPDGNFIAYQHSGQIWVMDAVGTNQHQVGTTAGAAPGWQPTP